MSATARAVARPLHGSVPARAFLFDPRLVGDEDARRRVLAHWTPGARVVWLRGAWLLVLPGDVRVRCDRAPGLPFVRAEGRLVATTARVDGQPADAIVWLEGGRVHGEPLSLAAAVDLAAWFDAGPVEVVAVKPLAVPRGAPRLRVEDAPPVDARERLGVPSASAESKELLRALLEGRAADGRARGRAGASSAVPGAAGFFARLVRAMRSAFASRPLGGTASAPPLGPQAKPKDPWWAPLRRAFDTFLFQSRIAQVIGRQHAKYLQHMLELFERGDVKDALRHAIPLGGEMETTLRSWARPRARTSLSIQPRGDGPASVWSLGDDLYGHLTRTYRSMFQRLEAQGRIEEAAFVLAELLRADAEAVAFLERHGRLKLAAELAEGRNLPPGLQVRQWFVAGDRARAMALAQRHGVFADVGVRLERSGRTEEARAWRLLWADALADAGDMLGAAEVVTMVPGAESLAVGWLDAAIAQGGPTGARALVRKLGLRVDAFAEIRDRAVELLAETHVEGVPERVAFAEALCAGRPTPETAALARPAARALVRDLALHGPGRLPPKTIERVVVASADGALRTDMPSTPERRTAALASRTEPLVLEWPATDVGRIAATDAALLPDGRVVVALGEIGLRLYHRDGRMLAHFDQPAERIVVSDVGDRLIALAKRGDTQRLARVDLLRRRGESWCEAPVNAFAEDYDGRWWFVGLEDGLYAIDAAAARWEALWRVPDLAVQKITRTPSSLCVAAEDGAGQHAGWGPWERFAYQLPGLVLRGREVMQTPDETVVSSARVDDKGGWLIEFAWIRDLQAPGVRVAGPAVPAEAVLAPDERECRLAGVTEDWIVLMRRAEAGASVLLLDRRTRTIRLRLRLHGADRVGMRVKQSLLSLADDRGRVIVIDLVDGLVLRDLRVV